MKYIEGLEAAIAPPSQCGKCLADSRYMWTIDGVEHYWQTGTGRSVFGHTYAFKDQLFCKSGDIY